MGLAAAGVLGIRLGSEDDAVVGVGVAQDSSFVVSFTEQGYAKRTAVKDFPAQKRYGGGVQAAKISARTGPAAVAAVAGAGDELALVTAKGRVTRLPVETIRNAGRASAGYRSAKDSADPFFEVDKHGLPVLLTVLAGAQKPAQDRDKSKPSGEVPTDGRSTAKGSGRQSQAKSADKTSPAARRKTRVTTARTATGKSRQVGKTAPVTEEQSMDATTSTPASEKATRTQTGRAKQTTTRKRKPASSEPKAK
jgi:hypothetical protein